MKPEERDAVVIEQCAMVCERLAREWVRADAGTSAYAAQDCANAIRALTAQSPAGVPPEPMCAVTAALAELVVLKDLKDALDAEWRRPDKEWTNDEWREREQEYTRRKPLAWEAARAALTAQSPAGVPPEPRRWQDLADHLWMHATEQPDGYWLIPGNEWEVAWANWRDAAAAGVPTTEPVAPIARCPGCFVNEGEPHTWSCGSVGNYRPQAPVEPVAQPDENEQLERMRERLRKANQSPMHADALSSREPATDGTPSGGPMRPVGIRDGGTAEPVAPTYKSEAIEVLAGWLHKWPGGAPNEAWSALSEAKVEMELLVIDYQKAAAPQAPVEPAPVVRPPADR
jgi:hypothetical protein